MQNKYKLNMFYYNRISILTKMKIIYKTELDCDDDEQLECGHDMECVFCENGTPEKCIAKSYIVCPECEHETSYGIDDAYGVAFNYRCNHCEATIVVCGECFDFDNRECTPLMLVERIIFSHRLDDVINYKETLEKSTCCIEERHDVPENEHYYVWKSPCYLYPDAFPIPLEGFDGGLWPSYYCEKCKKVKYPSDK